MEPKNEHDEERAQRGINKRKQRDKSGTRAEGGKAHS